jgi:type II secretory pathway pseudopilin PulG
MKNAFTLIEFLIYIAIVSSILVLISGLLWNIVFGNIKETAYQEVQQNGRFALTKISQEIKKATEINSPSPGSSANSLSLAMANPNLNPTVFDLADGKLRISQGTNPPIELTTDQVIISSLQFSNLSYEGTPGTIRIEMTISYLNPANRIEYQASIDLKTTVSLVPGGASP